MAAAQEPPTDELHCVLCCEDIEFSACGVCNHVICLKCCLKLRMLRKEHDCPVCRAPLKEVIVSRGYKCWSDKTVTPRGSQHMRNFGIFHEHPESQQKVDELLQHSCTECAEVFKTFPLVKNHLRKNHNRYYCDICLKHLKIFTHERKCYTREELVRHRKRGDADDKSHRGHPLCQFCDERYLDNDELLLHLRKNHFWCHLCEKDGSQDYFPEYKELRKHFQVVHFLCEEGNCVNEKFTSVFRSKIDFQAHKGQKHSDKLSKAEARQNRQLDINITFNTARRETDGISGQDYSFPEQRSDRYGGRKTGSREWNIGRASGFDGREGNQSKPGNDRDNESRPKNTDDKRRRDRNSDIVTKGANERDRKSYERNPPQDSRGNKASERTLGDDKDALRDSKRDKGSYKSNQDGRKISEKSSKNEVSAKKAEKVSQSDFKNGKLPSQATALAAPKKEIVGSENTKKVRSVPDSELPTKNCKSIPVNAIQQSLAGPTFHDDFPVLSTNRPSVRQPTGNNQTTPGFGGQKNLSNTTLHDDFPALSPSRPTPVQPTSSKAKTKQKIAPHNSGDASKVHNDFPAWSTSQTVTPTVKPLSTVAKNGVQNSKSSKTKKDMPVQPPKAKPSYHEEFPTLASFANGLEKSNMAMKGPPGLTGPVQPRRPPPGLSWKNPPNVVSSAGTSGKPSGNNVSKDTGLIKQIQQLLDNRGKSFADFKTISGQFRNGIMTAENYYKQCCELLGNGNIHKVFVKLIDLLPDEDKQKQLFSVYNDAKVRAKQETVKDCGDSWGSSQNEYNSPLVSHVSLQEDFPALPKSSGKKLTITQQNKPGAWVQGR